MVSSQTSPPTIPPRRRATSEEAKEARRRQILDAASVLFSERSYADVTMAAVARRAGVAKGTIYLYFSTKEELFLGLYRQRIDRWLDELLAALRAQAGGRLRPEEFARVLRRTLEDRPTLARLIALLHPVLEQNLELDTAVEFKRWLGERLAVVGRELEDCFGERLARGDGARLLLRINAIAVGLHQMAHPTGSVAEALELDDLSFLKTEFGPELEQTVICLLHGWSSD